MRIRALCVMLALAAPALAQSPGPARGTVLSAQNGDIACYIRIRDEAGQTRSWMADFDLCNRAERSIGRMVGLSWRAESVQHPSCQGDPNCRRTQRVMLISGISR